MSVAVSILVDPQDIQRVTDYLASMERRTGRAELLPILKEGLEPVVAAEKSYLSSHSKSGALEQSLAARSGSGDRKGTLSVFAAPTATVKLLKETWGKGRRQQQGWASRLQGKGRRKVFYGPIVHQGHRIVKRNAQGELYDTGKRTQPVPFAQQAVDAMGEQQAEWIAEQILDRILGA